MAASVPGLAVTARPRLSVGGIVARTLAAVSLLAVVALSPMLFEPVQAKIAQTAAIYAVIGLSLNVLLGHAGQISLGHQAFVGIAAFASGWLVSRAGLDLWLALPIAALVGALSAALLGLVALRLRGLYLALITLAYGAVAEATLFNIRALTGGGEGMRAPRPAGFVSDHMYLYLCLAFLGLMLLLDWRLVRTKAGRAIAAIRQDENVAATLGVNVTFYKIFAFALSGFIAGVGGSLFAHQQEIITAENFTADTAFIWVFMSVVGGLRSRAGVVIGSMFFAIFPFVFEPLLVRVLGVWMPPDGAEALAGRLILLEPAFGALLLVLTLILYPGGIGQQLLPLRRWMAGGPLLVRSRERERPGPEAEQPAPSTPASDDPTEPIGPGSDGSDAEATDRLEPAVGSGDSEAAPSGENATERLPAPDPPARRGS